MDTIELLKNKMNSLGREAQILVDERMIIDQRRSEIDIRLTHITGALSELTQMIQELEKTDENEAGNDSESRISECPCKTDEKQSAGENSVQTEENSKDNSS